MIKEYQFIKKEKKKKKVKWAVRKKRGGPNTESE